MKAHQFTHTGLRPWTCEVCNRSFNQKANMIRHLLIHSDRRQYNCQLCDKSFTQPQTLKAHMVVHAKHKPFQCQICRKYKIYRFIIIRSGFMKKNLYVIIYYRTFIYSQGVIDFN